MTNTSLDFLTHMFSLNYLENNFPNKTEYVFHYSTKETFEAIINNQCFWFTDSKYLNDTTEFIYGVNIIKETLENLKEDNEKDIIELILNNIKKINDTNLYVASFSTNGDLLSQWRGYGDNGLGISFGFRYYNFPKFLKLSTFQSMVSYKKEEHEKIIYEVIAESIRYFNGKENLKQNINFLLSFFTYLIASFKDESFSEESEYRFFILKERLKSFDYFEEALSWRKYKEHNIPYLNVTAAEIIEGQTQLLPVEKILVGPSNNFTTTENFIKAILKNKGYDIGNICIEPSRIPYRLG